jgi:hypothetical protein
MRRIVGRVLVKETGVGVPNLVVAAFDARLEAKDTAAAQIKSDRPSVPTMDRVGARLGSVLTDQDGSFSMTSEELVFPGNDARPDLVLVVSAPEDTQGTSQPLPLGPEQLVLYMSRVPRVHAGSEEAYIIRLLQAQLDQFGLPTGGYSGSDKQANADSRQLSDAYERAWVFRASLSESVKPRLTDVLQRSAARKKLVAAKLGNLSAVPRAMRSNPNLVTDPAKIAEVHQRVLKLGLDSLKKRTIGIKLHLSAETIATLRLNTRGQAVSGKVKPSALLDAVMAKTRGADLVRRGTPAAFSSAELLQRYSVPPNQPPVQTPVRKRTMAKKGVKRAGR